MKLNSETCHFIRLHARDDVHMLALQTPQPGVNLEAAIIQIAGRQALAGKVPSWTAHEDLLFPTRLPLEQCSSEATARYKAEVVRNCGGVRKRMADLTGGLGVDCAFLAPLFEQVDYVERQEGLCNLAETAFRLFALLLQHDKNEWRVCQREFEKRCISWQEMHGVCKTLNHNTRALCPSKMFAWHKLFLQ